MEGFKDRISSAYVSGSVRKHRGLTVDASNTDANTLVFKEANAGEQVVAVAKEASAAGSETVLAVFLGDLVTWTSDGSGTSISELDPLKVDADGKVVKADADHDKACGIAITPSSADGDEIWVMVTSWTLMVA